ncbi:unnamed protein product [Absidia cylindrospora]
MSYDARGQQRSRHDGRRYRDDYRRRNYRQASPNREDDVEDIQERLKGLIIKIGDKITPDLQVNSTR